MPEHEYRDKKARSLWLSDMQEVVDVMKKIEDALGKSSVTDAIFTVMRDDGEELADVWWDSDGEQWLCDWRRGSGD